MQDLLTAAVVVFPLFLFDVPFWIALGILGVLFSGGAAGAKAAETP
jgi:hypothetical protein